MAEGNRSALRRIWSNGVGDRGLIVPFAARNQRRAADDVVCQFAQQHAEAGSPHDTGLCDRVPTTVYRGSQGWRSAFEKALYGCAVASSAMLVRQIRRARYYRSFAPASTHAIQDFCVIRGGIWNLGTEIHSGGRHWSRHPVLW